VFDGHINKNNSWS